MAVVRGTNGGFVDEAPTANPGGAALVVDTASIAFKDVSPSGAVKITEIGWYISGASPETNYEIAIYSHHVGTDLPENRLYVDAVNPKGEVEGWKVETVDWEIDPETTYWIALQTDNTTPDTSMDRTDTGGARYSSNAPSTFLPNPWVSNNTGAFVPALYALVETEEGGTAIMTLNSGHWGGV